VVYSVATLTQMLICLQGFDVAKRALLEFLDGFKEQVDPNDREMLQCVARTSLRTKLKEQLADQLTDIVTDAVLTITQQDEPTDLYMVLPPCLQPWRSHCGKVAACCQCCTVWACRCCC
jgi:hypothetical protein